MSKIEFPLDQNLDPAICRDEYLKQKYGHIVLKSSPLYSTLPRERYKSFPDVLPSYQNEDASDSSIISDLSGTSYLVPPIMLRRTINLTRNLSTIYIRRVERNEEFIKNILELRSYTEVIDTIDLEDVQVDFKVFIKDVNVAIRKAGVYLTFSALIKRLLAIINSDAIAGNPCEIREIPHHLFSWSLKEFFKRCVLDDTVYIELLQKQLSVEKLDATKFKYDLHELVRFIKLVCKYYQRQNNITQKVLFDVLEETKFFINIANHLEIIRNGNQWELDHLLNTLSLTFKNTNQFINDRLREIQRNCFEQEMELMEIRYPIELRYHIRFYQNQYEQHIILEKLNLAKIENQIQALNKRKSTEQFCSHSSMNLYYTFNDNLRNKIRSLSMNFECDLENVENEQTVLQMSIAKAQSDLKFYMDQVKMFHVEIAKRIELEKDREVQDELELEQKVAADIKGNSKKKQKRETKKSIGKIRKRK